jgi:hypothetical protein
MIFYGKRQQRPWKLKVKLKHEQDEWIS